MFNNVTLKDFCPISTWDLNENGPKINNTNIPAYLIDNTTGKLYINHDKNKIRKQCILLTLSVPFVHAIASFANVGYRIYKLVTFSHFRKQENEYDFKKKQPYSFEASLKEACVDLLRIFTTPIAYVGLELAALYGVCRPYDGRKLYATIERAQYGRHIHPMNFQPQPNVF